jgi:L-lactate dehydrogenase complex protein LldE
VTILERLGHEIVFPEAQTCCGQMHINTGYRTEALALARYFVEVFSPYEVVVAPSASCVGTVVDSYANLAEEEGDAGLAAAVRELAPRVHELSGLLVDKLGVTDVGACFPHRVAYHPTCHSLRVLHLKDQPLQLLRAVEGLELVEFDEATSCCGFGGRVEERRHFCRDARRQDGGGAGERSRGVLRARQLLSHPYRRRGLPARVGLADDAPRRDPRRH